MRVKPLSSMSRRFPLRWSTSLRPLALSPLTALSAADGRYGKQTEELRPFFSEFGLIKYRLMVELKWFEALSDVPEIEQVPSFNSSASAFIHRIITNFDLDDAQRIKDIELVTNHDVKAVEYFLKEKFLEHPDLQQSSEFLHFACTSEDVNNLAYALMLKDCRDMVLLPAMDAIITTLAHRADAFAEIAMLSRTHGQPATPTTVGKEFANFAYRLSRQREVVKKCQVLGKCNGAVGNFSAHFAAFPGVEWETVSQNFVERYLGLTYNPYTTQIEPHDYIGELFHAVSRFNTILLDFDRDMWTYISLGYFKQKVVEGEIGSSTMPHKINPIDFENSEGNIGIANALLSHLAAKLPVSRMQRDLSDSTVMRSLGLGIAHSVIGYKSALKGLGRVDVNVGAIERDLEGRWELLAEPIQTVMRKYDIAEPYEKLKELTRGKGIDEIGLRQFIVSLDIPQFEKDRLLALKPSTYLGNAVKAARSVM